MIVTGPDLQGALAQVGVGHPDLDHLELGWRRNDAGNDWFEGALANSGQPARLSQAAPHWMGDGLTGDLMPWLAYYEVDVPGWKPKDEAPPYIPQVGNNCTSRGLADLIDLLQFMMIADGRDIRFIRACVEACYAFGLHKAGMRGDSGCYGGAMAAGAQEIGLIPYTDVDEPREETRSRLLSWAGNPAAVVEKYSAAAAPYRIGKRVRISTWEEYCAAVANRCGVTMASNVGYNTPRDERGICRRRGIWNHQMFCCGVVRSDGTETAVQYQSWGPTMPSGPRPFKLPGFGFRILKEDFLAQLAQNDCWMVGLFPGFAADPLADRWTNTGWAA